MTQILQKLLSVLTAEEVKMLQGYCEGELIPNKRDNFPNLFLSPNLGEYAGVFFGI